MRKVTVISRTGCHLCEIAIDKINLVKDQLKFELEIKLINDLPELEQEYGEQVPVIMIDNKIHDYWRVDIERFTKAIKSYFLLIISSASIMRYAYPCSARNLCRF